jgi:hypothetical protein
MFPYVFYYTEIYCLNSVYMAYKRKTLRQKRKTTRRRSASRSRRVRGGCNQGNCLFQTQVQPTPASLPHSNFSQNGGEFPPSFSNVPIRSFYPLNTYENDVSRQSISSTLIPSVKGGRRVRRRRSQKGGFEANQGLSTLLSYGASLQPSNINGLGFHDGLNRPYA